ncbi:MAG: glycosyltransferase family A protein [Bacteroidales bacterium]|nr:glycosyltransferase family A protein [Bacteroidales bacterium]
MLHIIYVLYLLLIYMFTLTVFTPTYNRANLLGRGYEALKRQTLKDFEWLIIDDGSSDNTKEVVQSWIDANELPIRYVYKENGGLHTSYNTAIDHIETELCVCVDSDDYMPDDAVEKIVKLWKEKGSKTVAGILGLDFFLDNSPIGGYFQEGIESLHIVEMAPKYNHHGDVKVVHRTELLKEVAPMPVFEGEKNFNPIYLFYKIDMRYPLILLNDNLCYVEYQPDGMTFNIYNQYVNSPRSFSELRKLIMTHPLAPMSIKFRNAIHYVSSQIMIRNKRWLRESPMKLLTLLAVPLGLVVYFYIKHKATQK